MLHNLTALEHKKLFRALSSTIFKHDEPEEKPLFGALRVYRERGSFLHLKEQMPEAKKAYDQAYLTAPEDVDLLIRRSAACVDALKLKQALKDANTALKLDPGNISALQQKARALSYKTEIEHSVVLNYRGYQRRKKPTNFLDGLNSGLRSIEEAIGKTAGHVLSDFLPLIRQTIQVIKDDDEPEKLPHVSRIPHEARKKILSQMETHKHELLSRVLAFKYLGSMAYDKFFLQDLARDRRIKSANLKGSEELKTLINDSLKIIEARQEILRAERPYYSIQHHEKTESKHQTQYKKKLLQKERETNTRNAELLARQVEACMRKNQINMMISKAERMQMYLDSKTTYTLPDKRQFMDRLYRAVGRGYLSQHRISYKLSERANRRRIAFLMGLKVGRPSSYDSVLANYPYKFTDPKLTFEHTKTVLETCENKIMKCWLNYELSKLSSTSKNFTMSKFYAKQCQRMAESLNDPVWWLNGCFALMGGDMQQGNVNEVKLMVDEAIKWARETNDAAQLGSFLNKCADMIIDISASDENKAMLVREKNILSALDSQTRQEAKILFKRISMVPLGRRFSVLPQRNEDVKSVSARKKCQQRHLSIIPGKDIKLPSTSRSPVAGFQIFED